MNRFSHFYVTLLNIVARVGVVRFILLFIRIHKECVL